MYTTLEHRIRDITHVWDTCPQVEGEFCDVDTDLDGLHDIAQAEDLNIERVEPIYTAGIFDGLYEALVSSE